METVMADFDAPEIAPKDREMAHFVKPETTDIAELEVPHAVDEEPAEPIPAPEKPRPSPAPHNDPYGSDPVQFSCCRG